MAKSVQTEAAQLLILGSLAGPLYLFIAAAQIALRGGFDPTRHSWSLLSNGDFGWIQTTNFLLAGALTLIAAVGMRKALRGGRARLWGPLLVGLYGLGLIGAGLFPADPVNGFPPNDPNLNKITTNGILHLVTGSFGFLGLIGACFVFAKRFAKLKKSAWSKFSLITGMYFFAAFVGIAAGSQPNSPMLVPVTLAFTVAVLIGWLWLSLLSLNLVKEVWKH